MATNPFDTVSTPTPSSGLLSDAINATQQLTGNNTASGVKNASAATGTNVAGTASPFTYGAQNATASTYGANTIAGQGYNAQNANASTYNAANMAGNTYDPSLANATNWNIGSNDTVQGQLSNVLAINNPLMKNAANRANQEMNARGLLNSSMAFKAGQSAVYDYAMPIAQADAATMSAAGKYNADVANQMSQFNANAKNSADQFNATSLNQAAASNQAATNAASQFNAQNQTQVDLTNKAAQNAAAQYGATATNSANAANQAAINQANQFNAQNQTQISLANQSAQNQAAATNAAANQQASQFNATAANTLQQQSLANTQQANLANQAAYNQALQNVIIGSQAGYGLTNQGGQVLIGYQAGYSDVGTGSTIVGYQAGYNSTGAQNTFVGPYNGTNSCGYSMTTGSKNTIIGGYNGNQGGLDIRTASNYIVLSDGDGNPRGYYNGAGGFWNFNNAGNNSTVANFNNPGNSTPYGLYVDFASTPNNTSQYFLTCHDTTNDKLVIYSNGTVSNRTGTYNAISDLKIKQDIVDATSQWDDIKAIRFRKYRLKDDVAANPDAPYLLGVVAQELEETSPGLVEDCADTIQNENGEIVETGEHTKSVKQSILLMKAAKALQEAMLRIEALEEKVAQLESK